MESPTDRDALLARIEGWTYDRALGADVAGGTTTPAAGLPGGRSTIVVAGAGFGGCRTGVVIPFEVVVVVAA